MVCNCTNVLVATLSAYVLGGLWYSPLLFMKPWTQSSHGDTNRFIDASTSPFTYLFTCLMNFMTASFLEYQLRDITCMVEGIRYACTLGIFLIFTAYGSTYSLSGNGMRLLLIDSLYHIAKLTIMTVVLISLK